ncbi:anthranilate synthase component I [Crassaminicella thermophila]|uniref:Anthranilate synthase component 1 n=1 Tax=Crassaminicella thermophila TaxID=2599308 RepID=A0A5C0SCZ4_CRATE|nr:anthranilate synthase component I [Crassaminicella thermophila]QEK11757.1 anthranilate synthase component I [Crassaminicella thermophila]
MFFPDFEKFKRLSKASKIIPISLEIEGDMDTPITLFKKLCKGKNVYLLESVEGGNKWGRYSYIGRNPIMIIKSYGNKVIVEKGDEVIEKEGNVLNILKNLMNDYKMFKIENMPDFTGGAVGYIGYDIVRNYEDLKNINFDDIKMPDIHLLLTDEVIVYDHVKQKINIVINTQTNGNIKERYKEGINRLKSIEKEILENDFYNTNDKRSGLGKVEYSTNETKEEFIKKVLKAKEYIRNGDIFQVVLSQRLKVRTEIDSFKAYRTLRSLNPSPYMFYIDFGEYQMIGSSPELLVKLKEDFVETCPIAGTRPRGKSIEEDEKYIKDLLNDEKERAEHLMLVDLARNDIGKISKFGTVEVNQFMQIQKYSHVMHIVSNVIGKIRDEFDMYDALTACLPAGTVSGAPKVRAMEIIDELESNKRGVYAGAVGYLGFNGNMDTCIAIRTIIFKDNIAYIQAGAGIVADSNPESEYEEILRKAKVLIETIEKEEGDVG